MSINAFSPACAWAAAAAAAAATGQIGVKRVPAAMVADVHKAHLLVAMMDVPACSAGEKPQGQQQQLLCCAQAIRRQCLLLAEVSEAQLVAYAKGICGVASSSIRNKRS